ncbi:ATP-dependent DNA helicase RecG [Leucobacter allii]|uniref:ATP-dependent DNA helicase RecG n=1 Tax=Leucobacter allii TaxID=2932247 RepID=UPI001FCFEEE1|nr:ATP-dependent DNA helicase RecG [Leucobacter allii]UOR03293.1 ATP-dependent DNA helicase RecG [Leucobacter allii]
MSRAGLDSDLAGVVGDRTAKALARAFEIRTVRELLWHFPRRYSNRGELTPLTSLPVGEHVSVVAQVIDVRERRMQRRGGSLLEVRVTDGVGSLQLTFFNQQWRSRELLPGRQGIFAGKVKEYRGALQLQHPDYQLFTDEAGPAADAGLAEADPGADGAGVPGDDASAATGISLQHSMELKQAAALAFSERPIPIYPAASAVPSWVIAKAVEVVLDALEPVEDPLPRDIRESEGVMALGPALELIHRPERAADWRGAQHSLRFREAFELQLALLDRRRRAGLARSTPRPRASAPLARFDAALPFALTGDQRRAGETIAGELAAPHPMHRLLQGEVGSGKTLVALRAMLQVAGNGGQSALLAPTEVLAAQHYRSIVATLGAELEAEIHPILLTGKMPAAQRKRALLALASGKSLIAVGTHALIADAVAFADLGLVVVDEQHRFGVDQREALRRKGAQPHVLAMTATPIPRTVALTAFGDLEVSTIRELPPGRRGIETFAVPELENPGMAARVWRRAGEDIAAGRQVYVVCPAIADDAGGGKREDADELPDDAADAGPEESERPLANVVDTVTQLRAWKPFAGFRIEGLSGDLPSAEKDRIMRDFAEGSIQILVATTVIEVGVNVPNASIMIVRDADRFGISQLHQLRGRVGRGDHAGLCLLVTRAAEGTVARERIEAVAATGDGFALAEIDLEHRREGDILGTAQSGGRSTLRLLRVTEHGELIVRSCELAATLLERDPELADAPLLAREIQRERDAGHLENLAKS